MAGEDRNGNYHAVARDHDVLALAFSADGDYNLLTLSGAGAKLIGWHWPFTAGEDRNEGMRTVIAGSGVE